MSRPVAGVAGVVVAGGRSRRMGVDKAGVAWGATTLLEHVLAVLAAAVDGPLVVVGPADRPHPLGRAAPSGRVLAVRDPSHGRDGDDTEHARDGQHEEALDDGSRCGQHARSAAENGNDRRQQRHDGHRHRHRGAGRDAAFGVHPDQGRRAAVRPETAPTTKAPALPWGGAGAFGPVDVVT